MAKFKFFLLISLLCLLFCSCEKAEVSSPALPPAELYRQMVNALCVQNLLSMEYSETTTMAQGNNTYTYSNEKQILQDTKTKNYHSAGILSFDTHQILYEEYCIDNKVYLTLNSGKFTGNHTETAKYIYRFSGCNR